MQIVNQRPQILAPVYGAKSKGDFDPLKSLKETIIDPLYTPVNKGTSVSFIANNKNITPDEMLHMALDCLGDTYNASAEAAMREVFSKTLINYAKTSNLSLKDLFVIQSSVAEKLPLPSNTVVYTPASDIIPACKKYLTGLCTHDVVFASFAHCFPTETLGFSVITAKAFDTFKAWLNKEINSIAATLSPEVKHLFDEFQKIDLTNKLTESFILRENNQQNNEEFSFARTLISYLMLYVKSNNTEINIMPFDLEELFIPKTIVFVNIDAHAHAHARQITDEWNIIQQSLKSKPKIVSNKSLSSLTGMRRAVQKIKAHAAQMSNSNKVSSSIVRACRAQFKPTAMTTFDLVRHVRKVIKNMSQIAKSENSYKSVKMSFARANRRNPDDFNLQGKIVSTKYKPDLHIYLDTSGSISERNYQDSIRSCINMAKKLNINLYFNSFSDYMSQCTKLNVKDKSVNDVYKAFQKLPKISGGTDYTQIWQYINQSKKRQKELSLIITDFEWLAPNKHYNHPKNLYYVPCSKMDWTYICRCASQFCQSMEKIDKYIRLKLLF